MITAAKEEMLSSFAPWCAETCISASAGENQKPRQGFARKNPALHLGHWFANSRTPLGLPICCSETALGPAVAANNGTNCTPLTKGCSNVPTAEQQCIGNFYNSTLGKAAAFGSPLALLPGWNPQWGSTMGDWAEAIVGKGGGIFGTGAAGTSGTTELTTLSGTRFVGSTWELWTGTALGAIEKVAPPAMLAATILDIGAHARCSALPGGALTTPSEGMYGAIP